LIEAMGAGRLDLKRGAPQDYVRNNGQDSRRGHSIPTFQFDSTSVSYAVGLEYDTYKGVDYLCQYDSTILSL
jgi:hypothetical protein